MMAFRTIKNAIVNDVLGPVENGRYQTVGYQKRGKSADEIKENLRSVEIYYASGSFDQRINGPTQHKMLFNLDLSVSSASKADLNVINNPASMPDQIKAALDEMLLAASQADELLDELIDIIYQIIMDGNNLELQLDENGSGLIIADRFIKTVNKSQPSPRGGLVVITAKMILNCTVTEEVPGDIGPAAETIETVTQFADIPEIPLDPDADHDIDEATKTGIEIPIVI